MSAQKKWFILFLVIFITTIVVFVRYMPERVDTIFVNGNIYTLDKNNSKAEAIAVFGDRIVGVGSNEHIKRKCIPKRVIDLSGKTVIPGLIDAHCHLLGLGLARLTVDLAGTNSEEDAVNKVAEYVEKAKPENWIRGRGWDQNNWKNKNFPTSKSLDRISPNNPVYLTRVDGHACWVNKVAMKKAGINKDIVDPPGGKIIRDSNGEPTGVFIDAAMDLIYNFVPQPDESEMQKAIELASLECLSYGLTSVHEMGVDIKQAQLYFKMIEENKFLIRLYAAVDATGDLWNELKQNGKIIGYGKNHLTIRAVKLYIDGALGSRGAALIEPYSDDPTNRGLTVISNEELQILVDDAVKNGLQVCTHSIGDRANNIIINAYESAINKFQAHNARLRVEHAQVLLEEDIPRFKKLGIIPSMQPTHCTSDMYWAEARLGSKRIRGAYAWRSLLNTGVIISGGSDFPVESPNPFLGIYAACTRKDLKGLPNNADDVRRNFQLSTDGILDSSVFENGWYSYQKMSREEAIRCFTTWAAYAAFEENLKGSIEKGKLADFIIISDDIFNCKEEDIHKVKVEKTILGGEIVYER